MALSQTSAARIATGRCVTLAVAAALLLVSGCGGTDGATGADVNTTSAATADGSTGGGFDGGSQPSADLTAEPPTETATTESAQPRNNGTSIGVASLPIGGNVDGDGADRCGHINWLGPTPIPDDVSVSLKGFSLDPDGVFRFEGNGCSGAGRLCTTDWAWTSQTATRECVVPLKQVEAGDPDSSITLVLTGSVRCVRPGSCDAFSRLGGSQIHFTALPDVIASSPAQPPSSVPAPPTDAPPTGTGESS